MLQFINNEIIFQNSYSLDHVITGDNTNNYDYLYDRSLSNLEFELSLVGYDNIENLESLKFRIPANAVSNLKTQYNSFKELFDALFENINNDNVFPYLGEDIIQKRNFNGVI